MPPKRKPPAPVMAPPIKAGTKLTYFKKTYIVGTKLGSGGFGTIYYASDSETPKQKKYALKIEPQDSGPLYCEFHFYVHICQKPQMKTWKTANKQCSHLGIPEFIGAGKTDYKDKKDWKLRWLVMPLYPGGDLHGFIKKTYPDDKLPRSIINKVTISIIWALKFMHDSSYAHADIKAMNILTDKKPTEAGFKAYLVDFGLAAKINANDIYKPDKKMAGNGTIEYTSRDAHAGAKPNARADMEILLYNVVHWACGTLPWMKNLKAMETVHSKKETAMKNTQTFIKNCWKEGKCAGAPWPELIKFAKLVESMDFGDTAPYAKMLACFNDKMKLEKASTTASSRSVESDFEEPVTVLPTKPKSTGRKKAVKKNDTTTEEESINTTTEEEIPEPPKRGRRKAPAKYVESSTQDSASEPESPKRPAKTSRAPTSSKNISTPQKAVSKASKRKTEDSSLADITDNVDTKLKVANARTPRQRRAAKSRVAKESSSSGSDEDTENTEPALLVKPQQKRSKLAPKVKKETQEQSPVKKVDGPATTKKPASKRVHAKSITKKNKNPVTVETQTTPGLKRRPRKK